MADEKETKGSKKKAKAVTVPVTEPNDPTAGTVVVVSGEVMVPSDQLPIISGATYETQEPVKTVQHRAVKHEEAKAATAAKRSSKAPSYVGPADQHPIWLDIKDVEVPVFGLDGQTVAKFVTPVSPAGDKLIVNVSIGSALVTIEDFFKKKYFFEQADKYIVISKL